MTLENTRIGLCICGSFCTFNTFVPTIAELVESGCAITPILSDAAKDIDTRFGTAAGRLSDVERITGRAAITTITGAEPIGPNNMFDILLVAPCTGNTLAKIAQGISDTPVTLAVKSHLRINRPVVVGFSSNDGLGANAKNLGLLLDTKHFYFIPVYQDDPQNKEKSVSFRMDLTAETIRLALANRQLQPVLASKSASHSS